ncbi:hypothetical protein DXJ87_21755 [Vibrio parahaemolyticus]|nr:hypothetical protein DXJ87_21755 [Vibrio parahaemolyticus]
MSIAELLRRNGHYNPEHYPLKKALALANHIRNEETNTVIQQVIFNHSSRVAAVTGDSKNLEEMIEKSIR